MKVDPGEPVIQIQVTVAQSRQDLLMDLVRGPVVREVGKEGAESLDGRVGQPCLLCQYMAGPPRLLACYESELIQTSRAPLASSSGTIGQAPAGVGSGGGSVAGENRDRACSKPVRRELTVRPPLAFSAGTVRALPFVV